MSPECLPRPTCRAAPFFPLGQQGFEPGSAASLSQPGGAEVILPRGEGVRFAKPGLIFRFAEKNTPGLIHLFPLSRCVVCTGSWHNVLFRQQRERQQWAERRRREHRWPERWRSGSPSGQLSRTSDIYLNQLLFALKPDKTSFSPSHQSISPGQTMYRPLPACYTEGRGSAYFPPLLPPTHPQEGGAFE